MWGAKPVFAAPRNSSIRPLWGHSADMNNEGILRKGQARRAKVSMFGVCGGAYACACAQGSRWLAKAVVLA